MFFLYLNIEILAPNLAPMNFTFKLKEPKSTKETLIYFRSYFDREKEELHLFDRGKIKPEEWDFHNRLPNDLNGRTKEQKITEA